MKSIFLVSLLRSLYVSPDKIAGYYNAAAASDGEAHQPQAEQGDGKDENAQAGRPVSVVEEHGEDADGHERPDHARDAEHQPAVALTVRRHRCRVGDEAAAGDRVLDVRHVEDGSRSSQ